MSLKPLSQYYYPKFKPFRYALVMGLISILLWYLLIFNPVKRYIDTQTFILSLILLFMAAFIATYFGLVIYTLFIRWLQPPRNFDPLDKDWWKP